MTVEAVAPAKVNLTLHVTGQRADGYHLLDSLVTFAAIGDRITVRKAPATRLTVTGRFAAAVPAGADNLICRAAALMDVTAEIVLDKALPVAAGLGGGSADAAAAVRAIAGLYDLPLPGAGALLRLGADVPVCMGGGMVRMRGVGDLVTPLSDRPCGWPMVLANPGVALPTGAVFGRLVAHDNPPMADPIPPDDAPGFADWLAAMRNDLEPAAIALAPGIAGVLVALRARPGCQVARMSGSGATCFGLFETGSQADAAAAELAAENPGWWVQAVVS